MDVCRVVGGRGQGRGLALGEDAQINNFPSQWRCEEFFPSSVVMEECDGWSASGCSVGTSLQTAGGCDRRGSDQCF